MYESGKSLFLIYEDMDVSHISLVNIQDSPRDLLNEIEIAIVYKQVSALFLKKKRDEFINLSCINIMWTLLYI